MANLSISGISSRILGRERQNTVERSSNPFAKTSFKGNVLTADVFQSSKPGLNEKLKYSAFVGAISNLNSRFKSGMESVISFGSRMKESVAEAYGRIHEIASTPISFAGAGDAMKARMSEVWGQLGFDNAAMLAKRPVSELRSMLTAECTSIEAL